MILYLHGRGGSSQGTKVTQIRERFGAENVASFDYATTDADFEHYVQQASVHIQEVQPKVVIASSFGGAVLLQLLHRGHWSGPCVFLAQAGVKFSAQFSIPTFLPVGIPAILIHGTEDDLVDIEGSVLLAESSETARLIRTVDGHRLYGADSTQAMFDALAEFLTP